MRRLVRLLALSFLCAGCFHSVSYDSEEAQKLQHVAVLVRVMGDPSADVPEEALGGLSPVQAGEKLEGSMSPFEAAERIRASLVEHLPDGPPWNTVVPAVQVETALGSLLTVERPVHRPDFDQLQQLGIDGVLYVEVTGWGAKSQDDQTGYYLQGTARLFTLPDDDTLWASKVNQFGGGPLTIGWMGLAAVRDHFGEVCAETGRELAVELGGTPQSKQLTPSLEEPEIEDTGHPPPPQVPVIPFQVPDAGVRDAGAGGIDITFPDGGGLPLP